MSPDEDEASTGVATAEPEAEQEQTLAPPDQPEPGAEQEQPEAEAEPTGDSGASATEDEGEADGEQLDLGEQLAEVLKGVDPELLLKALPPEQQERLRAEPQEPLDRAEVELQARRLQREQNSQGLAEWYKEERQKAWQPLSKTYDEFIGGITGQVKAFKEGKSDDITTDPSKFSQDLDAFQRSTATATGLYTSFQNVAHVQDAIESHRAFRYLTAEEKEALAAPIPADQTFADWFKEKIGIALDAAVARGAPEEVKKMSKAEAEKQAGLAEKLKEITGLIGQNGTKNKTVEAGSGRGGRRGFKTATEVHLAHAKDEITTAQARRELARLAKEQE